MADQLTERESHALEHLRKAQELDVSLAEYCRSFEVDVKELYWARRVLIRKGVLPGRDDHLSRFVAVHVEEPIVASVPDPVVCRIHHPCGMVIECTSFPPASWLAVLLPGAISVSA